MVLMWRLKLEPLRDALKLLLNGGEGNMYWVLHSYVGIISEGKKTGRHKLGVNNRK